MYRRWQKIDSYHIYLGHIWTSWYPRPESELILSFVATGFRRFFVKPAICSTANHPLIWSSSIGERHFTWYMVSFLFIWNSYKILLILLINFTFLKAFLHTYVYSLATNISFFMQVWEMVFFICYIFQVRLSGFYVCTVIYIWYFNTLIQNTIRFPSKTNFKWAFPS